MPYNIRIVSTYPPRRCRYAQGILVDPGEPSIEQIAQALDYVVFN